MSNLEKWINAILNEDAANLSLGSVRSLQMIKHEMERLQKENAELKRFEPNLNQKCCCLDWDKKKYCDKNCTI